MNRTAFPSTTYGSQSNDWCWSDTTCRATAFWAINLTDGLTGPDVGSAASRLAVPLATKPREAAGKRCKLARYPKGKEASADGRRNHSRRR